MEKYTKIKKNGALLSIEMLVHMINMKFNAF